MTEVSEIRIDTSGSNRRVSSRLRIVLLPGTLGSSHLPPLLDLSGGLPQEDLSAPFQLLEGQEYLYEWEGIPDAYTSIITEPIEVFQPDTFDGRRGRLRPGLATGAMQVRLQFGEQILGQAELEVRSKKISYKSEYRWMLRDIANQMTELVMNRFAASTSSFTQDNNRDPVTLYQRFAFLSSLLTSDSFQIAFQEILRRPHVAWIDRHETVRSGQPMRTSAHTVRQLSRPGLRTNWPDGPIQSIPICLDRLHTEATHDTTPNRFIRFVLERWLQVLVDIEDRLTSAADTPALNRGRREIVQVKDLVGALLSHDLFKDVGQLRRFPADDQVLQRREGYREVFRAYLEFELAARLSWGNAEQSYSAGQRDVASLYEHWAFIQLARLVAEIAGQTFDLRPLLKPTKDGLNIVLARGKETVVSGTVDCLGRKVTLELCFNKTFEKGSVFGSWSRPMRPDYSLIISSHTDEPAKFEPVMLHFDAKYRVNVRSELFGMEDEVVGGRNDAREEGSKRSGVLREDLLKMHAYRDAIRRSAGAYVLYPGSDNPQNEEQFKEYQELLPGLGAFALRPSNDGEAIGANNLRQFLNDVIQHVATRMTQHERGRYWLQEVFGSFDGNSVRPRATPSVRPARDTTVLLGFVKDLEHWDWIKKTKIYNVRTEDRPGGVLEDAELLYSQLLLLYSPDQNLIALARILSDPERISRSAMRSTGYPNPSSDYFCVQIGWIS